MRTIFGGNERYRSIINSFAHANSDQSRKPAPPFRIIRMKVRRRGSLHSKKEKSTTIMFQPLQLHLGMKIENSYRSDVIGLRWGRDGSGEMFYKMKTCIFKCYDLIQYFCCTVLPYMYIDNREETLSKEPDVENLY